MQLADQAGININSIVSPQTFNHKKRRFIAAFFITQDYYGAGVLPGNKGNSIDPLTVIGVASRDPAFGYRAL
jgi:hypothetical protein